MAKGKRRTVSRSEAWGHLAKAEEFLKGAQASSDAGRRDAALLDAIHSAISAADAVTVALAGVRSVDPDHQRAADLLDEVAGGPGVKPPSRQLHELLSGKNIVEYESRRARAKEATDAVKRAERLVSWARSIVAEAKV